MNVQRHQRSVLAVAADEKMFVVPERKRTLERSNDAARNIVAPAKEPPFAVSNEQYPSTVAGNVTTHPSAMTLAAPPVTVMFPITQSSVKRTTPPSRTRFGMFVVADTTTSHAPVFQMVNASSALIPALNV